ncbi:MAG: SDR family oxidoreductase [Planctomycetota bacterium]
MELQLNGKRALVTGSTKGIGRAIAQFLANEGCDVIVNGRTQADVDAVARELGGLGLAGDVATADGCAKLIEQAGELDILVNNTGIFEPKPFGEIPDEDWQRMFDVNVMSGVRLSRAVLPGMIERGFGRIIFISSESGLNIPTEMVHYGWTKTSQLAIARGIAKTAAGSGVTVNSVLPGPTWTEGVENFVGEMDVSKDAFVSHARPGSLTGRFGTPEEIAAAVVFLCSPRAANTTGATLRSDGGIVDLPF